MLASRGAKIVVADHGVAMDGEAPDYGTRRDGGRRDQSRRRRSGRFYGGYSYASTSPDLKTADKLSNLDLDRVMRVNSFAGMWMVRAAWLHMLNQRYGRIVYLSSDGIYGALGNADYAAAKSAYIGMMRCLALEGADHGIMVNVVLPSARTRMTERFHPSAYADWFFQIMTPEKVAAGVAYLLSDECDIGGEIFAMGGGRIARVTLAENEGVVEFGSSIEQARDSMPRVMADTKFFYPENLGMRSAKVAGLFGFHGGLEADRYTVRPVRKIP
jgi:short chain dehydrogenase